MINSIMMAGAIMIQASLLSCLIRELYFFFLPIMLPPSNKGSVPAWHAAYRLLTLRCSVLRFLPAEYQELPQPQLLLSEPDGCFSGSHQRSVNTAEMKVLTYPVIMILIEINIERNLFQDFFICIYIFNYRRLRRNNRHLFLSIKACHIKNLSHNHHFKWWFGLALIRAGYMLAPKGRVSQALLLVRL